MGLDYMQYRENRVEAKRKIHSERLQDLTQSRYQMGPSNVKSPVGQLPLSMAQLWHLLSKFFER